MWPDTEVGCSSGILHLTLARPIAMLDFLRDTFWQWTITIIVTVVVGVLAATIPVYLARARKRLSYMTFSWPLVEDPLDSRVQMLFDGQPVRDVRIVVIDLRYRGSAPVREEDYARPVSFDFGEDARVLSVEVNAKKSDDIDVTFTTEDPSTVRLNPVLLNDKDYVSIKMLVPHYGGPPSVSGRIAGIRELRDEREPRVSDKVFRWVFGNAGRITVVTGTSGLAAVVMSISLKNPTLASVGGVLIGLAGPFSAAWLANKLVPRL